MTTILAALLVGGGAAVVVTTLLARVRRRVVDLREILELPYGEHDVPVEAVSETQTPFVRGALGVAGSLVERYDRGGGLALALQRAMIPLRPAEYVVAAVISAAAAAVLAGALTQQWLFSLAAVIAVALVARSLPAWRSHQRRRAIADALPDALSLIASSMSAGHTFLRSIQLMVEEAEPPLAEEFARVVHETRLGDPLVDALDRMAERTGVRDLAWVLQAVRIQQATGGKLAELLHSLADFLRSREEVRREVQALTAEGRMSAIVLSLLPVVLVVAIQVSSPAYLAPMFRGWGLVVVAATVTWAGIGIAALFRMVKIEI